MKKNENLVDRYPVGDPTIEAMLLRISRREPVSKVCEEAGMRYGSFLYLIRTVAWVGARYEEIVKNLNAEHSCRKCGRPAKRRDRGGKPTKRLVLVAPRNRAICAECRKERARERYNEKNELCQSDPFESLKTVLSHAARRHKKRFPGVPHCMNAEWLRKQLDAQKGLCFYTGKSLNDFVRSPNCYAPGANPVSLDRLDSSLGYVEGNVVITFLKVNVAKGNMPWQEFVALCKEIVAAQGV